ncbi:hypothetical protein H5410_061774 [Solanum commersonii]|uniref:Reverse transcriptase domain-containing protein n=1 Tax=Solanum commersonii TaxID=4109 RepID=A0A9J5WA76_SOLCO|nr:hypothetical protein H5410_061774 [Solanum commersonii]
MQKWGPEINYLSYVDDTILFYSGQPTSIKKMMKVLRNHKEVSGRITGIKQGSFPFTYSGCLFFYGRKNGKHFEQLI